MTPLFEIRNWKVYFPFTHGNLFRRVRGNVRAVDDVSFHVNRGETFGLVGESGCGKSTVARSVLGLVKPTGGEMFWEGKPAAEVPEFRTQAYRRKIQMIFQDPYASLNPRMTVGKIIAEPMEVFGLHPRAERMPRVMELMDRVGLDPRYVNRYPHEFSGGQRQRVGIARALAVGPELIFCDEAVSALDVSIQAQVVNLLRDLKETLNLSYVFIAHDLSVVRHLSDRIGVMYLGHLVETASTRTIYENPRHPYTQALLAAVPIPDPARQRGRNRVTIRGEVASAEVFDNDRTPRGCAFVPRCPYAEEKCKKAQPVLVGGEHQVACFRSEKLF